MMDFLKNFIFQKYRSSFLSLLAIYGISFVLISCNNHSESIPNNPIKLSDSEFQNSRVFDGRDSVATGIDGFTATQSNFTTVTEFVRIQEVIVNGEKHIDYVEITDPDNLDPSTPLYESRENNPILDPGGNHVLWGDFSDAEGAVIAKCTNHGTKVTTHLSDLIPKGFYSIWIDIFEAGTNNRIGRLDYTDNDEQGRSSDHGNRNVFRASAQGEGHVSGFSSPKSLNGVEISTCMLNDVENGKYDWRVTGIYHIDGTAGIDMVNDSGTFVEQTGLIFEKDLPEVD